MRFNTVASAWLLPLSLAAAECDLYQLEVTSARSSTRWEDCKQGECNGRMQMFDVTVRNKGTVWTKSSPWVAVTLSGDSLTTRRPAKIMRLQPGDSVNVEIGVQASLSGANKPVNVYAHWADGSPCAGSITFGFNATYGIPHYEANSASVNKHEIPNWYRDGKFGIFIHWGVYSVPAYFSEWYWKRQEEQGNDVYNHHLATYGQDVVYDDFIANFTAANFDPVAWMDLISDTGARYFVPTTKHHDGYALFNMSSSISNRNSVKQNPHRDLIKELFDAAKQHHPEIHRGTYFSMPEFFTPASISNQGTSETFYKGPPKNAYTGAEVPYTGYVENDFVTGIQLPQMNTLMNDYDTEIMWCDIGGASAASQFAASFLNKAFAENKPVVINDRCGDGIVGDYSTPENQVNLEFQSNHWEVCRTMDPNSWGYVSTTPDSNYLTPATVVYTLVDVVSKNGNLLLNMGPKSDGTIPSIVETNLRAAGKWIKAHDESIFGTKYWSGGPGSGNFRYTTTDDAFYIHYLQKPNGSITISDKIPWINGDKVTVVGGSKHGLVVASSKQGDNLVLEVPSEISDADSYCWTFKITY